MVFGNMTQNLRGRTDVMPTAARRMRRCLVLLVSVLGVVISGILEPVAEAREGMPIRPTALINGRWFDGREFHRDTWYAVDGRLTRARPAIVDETIDLKGGFVIPPFGEAHNHNVEGPWDLDGVVARYLHDGVFYVRNPNAIREFTEQIVSRVNRPDSIDVVFAYAGLTATGGHPVWLYEELLRESRYRPVIGDVPHGWFNDRGYTVIDGVDDVEAKWTRVMTGRPGLLKVFLAHSEEVGRGQHDGLGRSRSGLVPSLLPGLVVRAHQEGVRVIAHVETAADFRAAVASGVDELAHVPGWHLTLAEDAAGMALTEDDARLAAAAGVVVTTTMVAMKPAGGGHGHEHRGARPGADHPVPRASSGDAAGWALAKAVMASNIRLLYRHGVTLAMGSDHAETSLAEAQQLHELGLFDNASLLKLWCEDTPRAIFPERRIGRFQEGYEASLLVLMENPLTRFEAVTHITFRMKQGFPLP